MWGGGKGRWRAPVAKVSLPSTLRPVTLELQARRARQGISRHLQVAAREQGQGKRGHLAVLEARVLDGELLLKVGRLLLLLALAALLLRARLGLDGRLALAVGRVEARRRTAGRREPARRLALVVEHALLATGVGRPGLALGVGPLAAELRPGDGRDVRRRARRRQVGGRPVLERGELRGHAQAGRRRQSLAGQVERDCRGGGGSNLVGARAWRQEQEREEEQRSEDASRKGRSALVRAALLAELQEGGPTRHGSFSLGLEKGWEGCMRVALLRLLAETCLGLLAARRR